MQSEAERWLDLMDMTYHEVLDFLRVRDLVVYEYCSEADSFWNLLGEQGETNDHSVS